MNPVQIDPLLVDLFVEAWNEERVDDLVAEDINRGWCYQFALVIHQVYGGTLQTPGLRHAWVRINGVDYDSDNLSGTLKMEQWWEKPDREFSHPKKFCEQWREVGRSGDIAWDVIDRTVAEYKRLSKRARRLTPLTLTNYF